jgi:hypothetical protein
MVPFRAALDCSPSFRKPIQLFVARQIYLLHKELKIYLYFYYFLGSLYY